MVRFNTRADDSGENETVWYLGASAQRERFGKELSAWQGGVKNSKNTTQ